ncbi:type II toxin-antitoxin system Phd/YefM family antitoxin [Arthrobacter sp. A5]|uniref:type II toxin-antitoxin system Phd/YefM family antitoxin n=1 Tax=Arthrobacter sp. A5 TaxID=576926 RepID=UPI003DA8EDD4
MGKSVGIRELRQNASAILAEALRTGEPVSITSHGKLQATLVPAAVDLRFEQRLIDSGALKPGTGRAWEIQPIEAPPGTPSSKEILDDLSADRL